MKTQRILALAAVLTLGIITNARATALFFEMLNCPDGTGPGYRSGYIDDMTGLQYLLVRGCDGSYCLYPLYGPYIEPTIVASRHWHQPANMAQLCAAAREITTPGAPVGIYIYSEEGDTLYFRNPVDDTEREKYMDMYKAETGGNGSITERIGPTRKGVSAEELNREFTDALIASYQPDKLTGRQKIVADLVGAYMDARYGADYFPQTKTENVDILRVATIVDKTLSNLVVRTTPTPSNSQKLVVAPVVPELGGQATVLNINGKVMWSGDVRAETEIVMSDYPTGMYFVQGTGRAQVINIVR